MAALTAALTIAGAVVKRWDTEGTTDFAASGGMWLAEIPQNKPLPFLVLLHGGERTEDTTEDDYEEMGTLSLKVFAVPVATAEALAIHVKRVFDQCAKKPGLLQVADAKVNEWRRTGYSIGVAKFVDEDNNQVGEATMNYRYTVHRILPAS